MPHDICYGCCKYSRKECPGQDSFPGKFPGLKPSCFVDCPDECPFAGDCPNAVDYPPEDAEEV